ncbi:MAG: hypothetical protein HC925_06890, partial [Coleofasciculaceae cyanobacterium SM2_3_26]|nr:hypothetical protein [Coleofasciculaceae cyanobacterium SM2_3_26]
MPVQPPLLALPSTHELWDCMAAELPDLCRRLRLRQRLDTMPVLSADVDNLPDRFLLRASTILGAFAHAYYYIDANAAPHQRYQPPSSNPGKRFLNVCTAVRRTCRTIDMSTYNWRWIDPHRADPMRVENLRLLVPIWGNEEERIFLGSTIEIQAQSAPLLGAIVRAQEAVWQDNPERLDQELAVIIDCLNHLTYVCLPKVVPNARSAFFVDPVVWAKTTAPLAVPIRKGSAGPVGAATMSLQVLDAFLERRKYASDIGRESIHVREWFPQHWVDFYGAVREISVPTYIQQKRIPVLTQLFQEVLHAYAGDTGFLGRHRLKAYGYIETAFKSGRPATAAFRGSFKNRVWENIDAQLELARQERYDRPFAQAAYHQARIQEVVPTSDRGDVARVTLTLEGSCAYYHPGDRCAILPENHANLVEKTLKALQAEGSESIQLDETWQLALQYRPLHRGAQRLALRSLLTFGQIRPLRRPVARLLLDLVQDTPAATVLERVLHAHTEEEWELWDMLEQLQVAGFDPRTLWQPGRETSELPLDSKPQSLAIAQVVPPESFRLYSISSVMAASVGLPADLKVGDRGSTTEVQLTVGVLQYQTAERTADSLDPRPHKIEIDCQPMPPITRRGTASQFLTSFLTSGVWGQIAIKIVPSPRFHLPPDS